MFRPPARLFSSFSSAVAAGASPCLPIAKPWRLRRAVYLLLGGGALFTYDTNFNASALSRTFRTFAVGAVIATDYKLNFTAHPPFASSIAELHARNAERVYTLLRANGGLYLKIGQAIAMQSAVLPPEFQKQFAKMFDDAPANDWADVERVIREEFSGRSSEQVFGEIEKSAKASASVAQVHRARLPDGRIVAVKVQKKEIEQQVGWDLWAFGAVMYLYSHFFDLPLYPMVPYIKARLQLETDFINEANNAERTADRIAGDSNLRGRVYVPKVYRELTTRRVMTAEWIDGVRLSDKNALTASAPGGLGARLSDVMQATVDLFCAQIFLWGDVHCDPHPGNILVRPHPSNKRGTTQIVLLDHGLYVHFSPTFRRQYASFWTALIGFDNAALQRIAASWGVRDTDAFASATLMRPYEGGSNSTARMLASVPEGADEATRAFAMQQRMRAGLREILGDERIWPRELLFLGRTIRILQADNQLLGSPVNRIKTMGLYASRALASDTSIPLKTRVQQWFRHLLFRTVLLSSDVVFYASRIRQIIGWGEGMESDMEKAMREVAKKTFGVELNHDLFEG